MSFLKQFPDRKTLLNAFKEEKSNAPMKINNHTILTL